MSRCIICVLAVLVAAGCAGKGIVTRHYTNGEKKEMLVRDGTSIQWNTDNTIRNKCEFRGWDPYTGRWITAWSRNLLQEERGYKDGKLHGDWIKYDWKGRPKWGRGYYMGVVSRKMTYKDGKPWKVKEYPARVEKVKRKAAQRAKKIEERARKRLEKEKRKQEALERKEAAREKKLEEAEKKRKEREKAKEEREKEREEAREKREEEREERIEGARERQEEREPSLKEVRERQKEKAAAREEKAEEKK
jgi:flagellar biosynthesis GTPase FlhF